MDYVFHFGDVWDARDELLGGAWLTVAFSAVSMALSLLLAVAGAFARLYGPRAVRWLVAAYVELVRNTPFLVQVFLIFFGLPVLGLRLETDATAVLALTLNGSAYAIEIVRAGIESVGRGQVEAARALGLRPAGLFRLVVLPQALRNVLAPLGSQFILLMLNSSVVSVISADELTSAAEDIQGRTFRAFEAYIAAAVIYLALSLLFSAAFSLLGRAAFRQRVAR